MASYVRFPGTTDHVSTEDINELDGDAAHLANGSIGSWASGTVALDTADGYWMPSAGCKSIRVAAGATGSNTIGDYQPAEPSQEYIFGGWFKSATPGTPAASFAVKIWWYLNSGGSVVAAANGAAADATDENQLYVASGVCPAGANTARWQLANGASSVPTLGSAFFFRKGSLAEFVPSLRVSTPVETVDPADMPIVFAADGTPLTVGEGWAGSGYRYIRQDGTGPIVADFNPSNIPVV